jgi:hypothetical protein
MTKRRAERLTGYEIRELPPERGLLTADGEKLMVKAVGPVDFIALQALVNGVYFFNSRKAMEQHGWRCARCHSSRKLEIYHRKYRSHGGTHRVENLEPVIPEAVASSADFCAFLLRLDDRHERTDLFDPCLQAIRGLKLRPARLLGDVLRRAGVLSTKRKENLDHAGGPARRRS